MRGSTRGGSGKCAPGCKCGKHTWTERAKDTQIRGRFLTRLQLLREAERLILEEGYKQVAACRAVGLEIRWFQRHKSIKRRRLKPNRSCPWCGKEIPREKIDQIHCSMACANKAQREKWRRTAMERLFGRADYDAETGCIEHPNGALHGYPLTTGGLAYRVAYKLCVGPIPKGLEIDHLCRNRRCIAPGHLEAVTPEENKRRIQLTRLHCPSCSCGPHSLGFRPV